MERIKRSWQLAKASLAVLKQDKELLLFPLISSIIMVFVTLTFLIPTLFGNFFDQILNTSIPVFGYIVLFLFYLVQYTVVYFNNTALVGAAMIRLRGGDPKVKDGFQIALSRFGPILGWSLFSATVGLILNGLSRNSGEKGGGVRSFIASMLGAAWNVGPVKAIERSFNLLKRSWGEQIAGTLSIGLVFGLIGVVGGVLIAGLGVGLSFLLDSFILGVGLSFLLDSFIPGLLLGILLIVFILTISLLSSTLNGIFSAAVYAYAAEGQVGLIDESLIRGAINPS